MKGPPPSFSTPHRRPGQQVPVCGAPGFPLKEGQQQGWAGRANSPLVLQALPFYSKKDGGEQRCPIEIMRVT